MACHMYFLFRMSGAHTFSYWILFHTFVWLNQGIDGDNGFHDVLRTAKSVDGVVKAFVLINTFLIYAFLLNGLWAEKWSM